MSSEKKRKFTSKTDLCENLTNLKMALISYSDIFEENSPPAILIKKIDNQVPTFVLVGDQSAGKSSIVNRIVHHHCGVDIGLYTSAGCATKCPTLIHFKKSENSRIVYKFHNKLTNFCQEFELDRMHEVMSQTLENSADVYVEINIEFPNTSTFSIIDLPGILASNTTNSNFDAKKHIQNLIDYYIKSPNCTIMHIINASSDLNNSTSIEFIRHYNIPVSNQLVVLSQLDRAEQIQDGVKNRLLSIAEFFPDHKIFLVQPSDARGYITSEIEIKNLTKLVGESNYHLGIAAVCSQIPIVLEHAIDKNKDELFPDLIQLKAMCEERLTIIGYTPPSSRDAITRWSKSLEEVCEKHLKTKCADINRLADDSKNKFKIDNFKDEDLSLVAKKKIEECRINRGRQLKELISLDEPFKECIQDLKKKFKTEVDKYNKHIENGLNHIVDKIIKEIDQQNPACELATTLLSEYYLTSLSTIWKNHVDHIEEDVNVRFNNPEMCGQINKEALYSFHYIKEYMKTSKHPNDATIKNCMEFLERRIYTPSDTNVDIDIIIVLKYVKEFCNEFNNLYPAEISSRIHNISESMLLKFKDKYIFEITLDHEKLVKEDENISFERKFIIDIVDILNKILS